MNHQEAQTMNAPERYVLNEMPLEDRDAFEEHYFDCLDCARDVREWASFVDSTKAVARADNRFQRPPMKAKALRTAPYAVAAMLAGVVAWQGMVMQGLRVAQVAEVDVLEAPPAHSVMVTALTRAGGEPLELRANVRQTVYLAEVAADEQYASYRAELLDAAGKFVNDAPISLEQTREPIGLVVGPLPAGTYTLVILGVRKDGNRSELTRQQLKVRT